MPGPVVNSGDLGFWWRMQEPRTLHDMDQLHQYKLHYASKLSATKVKDIEDNIKLYSDADQFRIYHAKGRFRGFFSASLITGGAFTFLAKQQGHPGGGRGLMKAMPYQTWALFLGSYFCTYHFWSKQAGLTDDKYYEFQYARVHKMLRNAIIRQ